MSKLTDSFKYAFGGWKLMLTGQRNFWVQVALAALAAGLGFLLHISRSEWLALIIVIALVLSLEMVNSALETLADAVNKNPDPLIKKAKDLMAGAVMLAAFFALVTGAVIFLPRIFYWLFAR